MLASRQFITAVVMNLLFQEGVQIFMRVQIILKRRNNYALKAKKNMPVNVKDYN